MKHCRDCWWARMNSNGRIYCWLMKWDKDYELETVYRKRSKEINKMASLCKSYCEFGKLDYKIPAQEWAKMLNTIIYGNPVITPYFPPKREKKERYYKSAYTKDGQIITESMDRLLKLIGGENENKNDN